MTREQKLEMLRIERNRRIAGLSAPVQLRGGARANARAERHIDKIKGGYSQARPGTYKPTAKQIDFVRNLEALTGTEERALSDLTRIEVSDYIETLKYRANKQRAH